MNIIPTTVDSSPASALEFSRRGDQIFDRFATAFPAARKWRLLIEQPLASDRFEQIQASMLGFLAQCLNSRAPLSEAAAMEQLLSRRSELVNYTSGGMLAPTREQTLEFNQLHRSVASAFSDFALEAQVGGIDLPINVRIVYGQVDESRAQAPFSSSKLHSDVWAGVPADSVVVVLPVLGDIANLTIACAEIARDQELRAMRSLSDYDEGRWAIPVKPYHDASMKLGHLYMADVRLLHQTIRRKAAGVRVSIDFRLRYADPQYRAMAPAIGSGGPDSVDARIAYADWQGVGRDSLIVFEDSLADLRTRKGGVSSAPVNSAKYRSIALLERPERRA
jgi:hypothetical protein